MRALALLVLLVATGCGPESWVRTLVVGAPSGTRTLFVAATVDNRDAPPLRLDASDKAEPSFALAVPREDFFWLIVDVTAVDANNCELATIRQLDRPSFTDKVADLVVTLEAQPSGRCGGAHHAGMLAIPAGDYPIGADPEADSQYFVDELPQKKIAIPAFEIDRFEITRYEYAHCARFGPCTAAEEFVLPAVPGQDQPDPLSAQNGVTWAQAQAYCGWLGRRLPYESEWEAAVRGPTGSIYPWGDDGLSCERANYFREPNGCRPTDVNLLKIHQHPTGAAASGVEDAAGNVWEWTQDYAKGRYGYDDGEWLRGPVAPDKPGLRVQKGGGAGSGPRLIRSSARYFRTEDGFNESGEKDLSTTGFRCARDGVPVATAP